MCVCVVVGSGLLPGWRFVESFWGSFFPLWFLPLWVLNGKFVITFIRFVDDLIKVFCGEFLLGSGCCVCSCMSEVVCGSVSCVNHVGLLVKVLRRGGQRLGPDVLGVQGVVVETQSVLGPCTNDPTMGVVIDGVLLVVAPHCAVTVLFFSEGAFGTPSAEDGVPASEADSRCEVFHNALHVIHASACVDARPSLQVPSGEVCPDLLMHVECR